MIAEIEEKLGSISVLVNNAGIFYVLLFLFVCRDTKERKKEIGQGYWLI
jgi:NAD(P)-dependent dehydrogenase (short-subunit alcohol dehydrogenase family)